jgi:hypothetical protein
MACAFVERLSPGDIEADIFVELAPKTCLEVVALELPSGR